MSAPRSTIDDVARRAGVSVATVSRALRGMRNVATTTRQRVVEAAQQLEYHPHAAASWLASGRTMTIGVAAPYFGIWYTGKILAGIERVLSESGYDLVVYAADPPDNRDRFLDRAASLQTRIDGLILVDFFPDDEQVERMLDARLEIVAIGEYLDPFSSLAVDNEAAAFEAVSHLIDLGHRRVAIFGTEDIHKIQSPVLTPRRAGYARALGAAGIDVSHALDIDCALSVAGGAAPVPRTGRSTDRHLLPLRRECDGSHGKGTLPRHSDPRPGLDTRIRRPRPRRVARAHDHASARAGDRRAGSTTPARHDRTHQCARRASGRRGRSDRSDIDGGTCPVDPVAPVSPFCSCLPLQTLTSRSGN